MADDRPLSCQVRSWQTTGHHHVRSDHGRRQAAIMSGQIMADDRPLSCQVRSWQTTGRHHVRSDHGRRQATIMSGQIMADDRPPSCQVTSWQTTGHHHVRSDHGRRQATIMSGQIMAGVCSVTYHVATRGRTRQVEDRSNVTLLGQEAQRAHSQRPLPTTILTFFLSGTYKTWIKHNRTNWTLFLSEI